MDRLRTILFAIGATVTVALSSCGDPGNRDPSEDEAADTAAEFRPGEAEATASPAAGATTAAAAGGDVSSNPPGDECGASKVSAFVSQKATADVKAKVAAEVGHSTIRWIGPDTAVTEDFSPQRLNVTIDANDVITRATCG